MAAAAPALTRLTALIEADTTGFGLGGVLKETEKFNKQWEQLNKKMAPAKKLWTNLKTTFGQVLGIFKSLLAPLAIAGGLFTAFFLAGQAGRSVFKTFLSVIGAFSDILVAALMPAIQPIIQAIVELLPMWQEIFGSPKFAAMMKQLGEALALLVKEGLTLFIELIGAAVEVMPILLPSFVMLIRFTAEWLRILRETGVLQVIVKAMVLFGGAAAILIGTGLLAWFIALTAPVVAVGLAIKAFPAAFGLARNAATGFSRVLIGGINAIIDGMNRIIQTYNDIPALPDLPLIPRMPTLQKGGMVMKTGLAVVHENEWFSGVGPGAAGMGGVTVNINSLTVGAGASQQDAREFVDFVADELNRRRLSAVSTIR